MKSKDYMKYVSLFVLVVQTTTMVLLLRYSRTVPVTGKRYLSSTVVVIAELLKILVSIGIIFIQEGSLRSGLRLIKEEVVFKPTETSKLLIPAALYTVQNNLLFLALSNLDAATYQVTYQLKILITALFSVSMLSKKLVPLQWFSLVLLMAGVAMVQMPNETKSNSKPIEVTGDKNHLTGVIAVLLSCVSSGFSGVYFEKLLKSSQQSLWVRNVQLSFFGFVLALAAVVFQDFSRVQTYGFFQGYDSITWTVVCLHTFGGLVVGFVMKYADNILKGFATSVSIVLSTLFSYALLADFIPGTTYLIGASVVIFATILYAC